MSLDIHLNSDHLSKNPTIRPDKTKQQQKSQIYILCPQWTAPHVTGLKTLLEEELEELLPYRFARICKAELFSKFKKWQ